MKKFAIITDSTSDLGKELREKYNIDYAKMNIVVDGKEVAASLDWEVYSAKELYDMMRNKKRVFTTQVPHDEFVRVFKKHLDDNEDILYISCSSALSGSINIARKVCEELKREYKDANIVCFDSLCASLGQGAICIKASEERAKGKSLEEVVQYLETIRLDMNQLCTVGSLTYLKNAGRVKASSAFFGNLFGVKPIIISDAKGQNFAIKKVKGRKGSLNELLNMLRTEGKDVSNQVIYISHADCIEDVNYLKDAIEKEYHPLGVYVNYIGPIVGASVGPDTVAIYVFGKTVTIVGE